MEAVRGTAPVAGVVEADGAAGTVSDKRLEPETARRWGCLGRDVD